MEKKTAVYICTGCDIGKSVDVDQLIKSTKASAKIPLCRTHAALCSSEGLAVVQKDIADEGVNAAVMAACSPRVCEREFGSLNLPVLERANLREQVVWTHPPNDEDTQMLARDQILMSCVRAQKVERPVPFLPEGLSKKILVVGGGITGMTAALEASEAGYEVALVEKEKDLGGLARRLHRSWPTKTPYCELEPIDLEQTTAQVQAKQGVRVLVGAEVESIVGAPGLFDATIKQNGSVVSDRFGAIILATGALPYDEKKLPSLGLGTLPNVVTNVTMEEMAHKGALARPTDGGPVNKVAFVQCAGSRDKEHLPYCSAHCCRTSLKQALYVLDANPEAEVFVIHQDIRAPGQAEEFFRTVQERGVTLLRGKVKEVTEGSDGAVTLRAEDVLLGQDVLLEDMDLVVLATGLVPSTRTEFDDAEALRKLAPKGSETAPADPGRPPATALHLGYRQGPELPNLKYGFPDSHFICFPYETRRTGIYAAGSVRRPGDMEQCKLDATGAALKAIQCVEQVARGQGVHPRVGDASYPEIFAQRCTQCKRCTEECPFGAYDEDEKSNPLPNPTRCRRCGVCMGACPERVISFKDYSVEMVGQMLKCLEIPEDYEEKPRVLCFVCENDAYPALDMVGMLRKQYSAFVRFVSLRCLGSVNLMWINDALNRGYDGILLLGCKHGDDYQCHFIHGSELANTRMSKISETLQRLMLESDRIRIEQVGISDVDRIPAIIQEFMQTIERVGPNPFKGM
ncbi:MAG: FAD-dependent oxidoreductase [Deltaproteobacteria bacterium]|nr:FAD-dependent oxidoreductase [Deltaproteobacteria bacterium]